MPDPAQPDSEFDRIDPPGQPIALDITGCGHDHTGWDGQVRLLRLQTRQLFRLLRILTHGGLGTGIMSMLDFSAPAEEFTQRLLTMLVLSIPDAEQEALEFLAVMTEPLGLSGRPRAKLPKADAEREQHLWDEMNTHLVNPPIDDTISLIEGIIRQEAPEFQALGKRLAGLLRVFQATGQDKAKAPAAPANTDLAEAQAREPEPQEAAPEPLPEMAGVPVSGPGSPVTPSGEPLPESLISYQPSTGGETG